MIMGFVYAYEYTYQDHEYIIRTMNTEHAQLVKELVHSDALSTFVIKLLRQC